MEKRKTLVMDIHIPYCIYPEKYLRHFNAIGTNEQKNMYLEAAMREVLSYEGELEEYEIRAIRLGGGSATVMKPDLLGKLLSLVRHKLPVAKGVEVSFDALPNTIGTPSLTGIAAGNPNRTEMMMRSDNDEELKTLNCAFRTQDVRNALFFLNKFHVNNISLTVNYGIPGQTMNSWHDTLHTCTNIRPHHITIEPLAVTDAEGMPDEQTRFEMYDHACSYLVEKGYIQYAGGLFCQPRHEYRFEALKMNGASCIGIGVNACTVLDGYFTRNTNNCGLYVKNAGDFSKLTSQVYKVDENYLMRNYIEGRLKLLQGLEPDAFQERFGRTIPEKEIAVFDKKISKGLMEMKNGAYVLTRKGLFLNENSMISNDQTGKNEK
ncbi:MAG: hypothetical protein LUH07_00760 [Lachnospiraceae bacterium]|nr:hypothetical protein [Lachnospiraceae bacterium]